MLENINYKIVNKDEFDLHQLNVSQALGGTTSLTTSSKEVVSAINELNEDKVSKTELNDYKLEALEALAGLGDRIDTITTSNVEGVTAEEIIDARGGEVSLGAKIRAMENVLKSMSEFANPFVITLTTATPTVEIGNILNSNTFSWSYNYGVVSQAFDGETLDTTLRSKEYLEPLASERTFELTATSVSGSTKSKAITVKFANGIYYGNSSIIRYDSDLIKSLPGKILSDSRARTISVSAGEGEYIYYCIPSRLGSCTFTVGGFTGGFLRVSTISFTNNYGYTEDYDIYRSDNKNLGSLVASIS